MKKLAPDLNLPQALLAVLVAAVYARAAGCGFVFDDHLFTTNPHILQGLTLQGLKWALTNPIGGNWMPVFTLSEMLEVQLFGLHPATQHIVNVVLHGLNTLLLLRVLTRMTGARWRSAVVAALFAVHPFHVESVVFGRIDLLSTLFGLLALAAHLRYAGRPGLRRYLPIGLWFGLSLASKQMLVTLPFLLLLLDFWPLNRPLAWRLAWEKIPLLLLSAIASTMVYFARQEAGAMSMAHRYPLPVRLANGLASYLDYLWKTAWPSDFIVMYPHPGSALPGWKPLLGGAILLLGSTAVVLLWRRRPFLSIGWFWFLGVLVPVIGLVQVGEQAMADRYTYVPLVGLFIALAWSWPRIATGRALGGAVVAAVAVIAVLGVISIRQLPHWRNNRSLYRHAIDVAPENWIMRANLAWELTAAGEPQQALEQQRAVVRLRPDLPEARFNLALALDTVGQLEEAADRYREALQLNPHWPVASLRLGRVLLRLGRPAAAVEHLARAARRLPGDVDVRLHLGNAAQQSGDLRLAAAAYREALALQPQNLQARQALATLLPLLGD